MPEPCPASLFCGNGTRVGTACLPGTHSTVPGLASPTECPACPAGSYCVGGVVAGPSAAGYVCYGGCDSPTPQCAELDACEESFVGELHSFDMCAVPVCAMVLCSVVLRI